jgi:hypothetical protein
MRVPNPPTTVGVFSLPEGEGEGYVAFDPKWIDWFLSVQSVANLHLSGLGSPEGVVTAKIGTIYSRLDGGTSTTLYVKESGTGATGWVPK